MKKFKQILYEQKKPTDAQIKAGNYKKRKVQWNGLTISIENDAGSYREGTDPNGNTWKTKMYYDYGYINGTMAKDGDQIDIFIGPNPKSELVFVINQIEQDTGNFDEYKCMVGFDNKESAIAGYLKNYEKGWKVGEVIGMSLDRFKEWIKEGNHNKPAKLSEMRFKYLLNEDVFTAFKSELQKNNEVPFEKTNIKLQVYRVGSIKNTPRGIFFANNEKSAQSYASLHDGEKVKKYEITFKKVLIAGHQSSVTKLFFSKYYGEMMDKIMFRTRDGHKASVAFDKKILNYAKKHGYDGIIYTKPAPPADMEIMAFSNKNIKEI